MANYAGYSADMKIGTNVVAGLREVTFTPGPQLADVTTFNSSGNVQKKPTLISATISANGDYDATDTNGQVAILGAFLGRTELSDVKWLRDGTSGYKFSGYVSSLELGASVDGIVSFSCTVDSNSAISATTV